jgi:hypothetical protein
MAAQNPYALKHLLPAGTVLLYFEPETAPFIQVPVDGSDDWDSLGPFLDAHGLQIAGSSRSRLQELEFLIRHKFVRATWRALIRVHLHLHVRVYLVPFDLPGVCGCLAARNRDESKVLLPARKALTSLLTNTNRSEGAWSGHAAPGEVFDPFISGEHVSYFFPRKKVTMLILLDRMSVPSLKYTVIYPLRQSMYPHFSLAPTQQHRMH